MTDKHVQAEAPHSNMEKDPSDWVTGDEPMTGAQKSYLKTLSEEAGTEFDESLTKAAASEQIDALQKTTGRGSDEGSKHKRAASAGESSSTTRTQTPVATSTKESGRAADESEPEEGDLFDEADADRSSNR